jgi:hypothetical protein
MNARTYNELSNCASESLMEALFEDKRSKKQLAKDAIDAEMKRLTEAGAVLQLTDEEMRLLRSFRRFKLTANKPGSVFKWQTQARWG